jgi:hypothetical protein
MTVSAMIAATTTKMLGISRLTKVIAGSKKIMTIENKTLKVGDEIRFGMQLMIVDEITEFDTIIAIDEDGQDFELTENEIDIY